MKFYATDMVLTAELNKKILLKGLRREDVASVCVVNDPIQSKCVGKNFQLGGFSARILPLSTILLAAERGRDASIECDISLLDELQAGKTSSLPETLGLIRIAIMEFLSSRFQLSYM